MKRTHKLYNELGLQLRKKTPKRRVRAKLRQDQRLCRVLHEILAKRGITVDHTNLNRWVVRYSPQITAKAHMYKRPARRV